MDAGLKKLNRAWPMEIPCEPLSYFLAHALTRMTLLSQLQGYGEWLDRLENSETVPPLAIENGHVPAAAVEYIRAALSERPRRFRKTMEQEGSPPAGLRTARRNPAAGQLNSIACSSLYRHG